ncbi:hypothetical protein FHR24_001689 [Wenyingzhuangia heitensis]|uniref:DUF3822 family protein n=1 Tax=Wenyingzhuangia heitensis TaxID=1487859 RepID=A0ABX0UBP5_9FLAO|nr:DUF3822 family protein [Wenyingzhuangia heitensis]NIJ45250.1 hypothetical protein [Wenyingzhuangia heitensis]
MNKENHQQNNKRLSIQLSSDGFSFCTYTPEKNQYETFKHIEFSTPTTSPNQLLQEVKLIFEKEEELHKTYKEVVLIHHNNLNSFVPKAYFDESLLSNYLENTIKTFENDFISYDEIDCINANNVYIPFVNINNFIFDSFGTFTYLHSSTVFLENILKEFTISKKQMFVNVSKNNLQTLVIENNQLVLANYFSYVTKEDFAYYLLFVAEQLKMDPNQFTLTLFGEINEQAETFKVIYNYVRNVSVYAKLNTLLNQDIKVLPQEHYNLLHL